MMKERSLISTVLKARAMKKQKRNKTEDRTLNKNEDDIRKVDYRTATFLQ